MNSLDSIPLENPQISTFTAMKMVQRWLLYTLVPRQKNGVSILSPSGKPKNDKIPYYVNGSKRSGALDSESDIASLDSYENAVLALNGGASSFDGLAFALGGDGFGFWQGVDLDDVIANGNESIANEIQGYVEVSPSDDGCHAIGYGEQFSPLGSNGSGIEAYSEKRFFTVSEKMLRDDPPLCLCNYVQTILISRHERDKLNNGGELQTMFDSSGIQVADSVITELRSALTHLRSDDRDLWIKVGMALISLGVQGRGLWLNWSATSEKHNPREDARKWDGFKPSEISYKTVFHLAQEQGWVNPLSNAANSVPTNIKSNVVIDTSEPQNIPLEYLHDPYVPKGFAIGFFGRGGSSKSTFIATLVSESSSKYSTLWITSEENPEYIKIRHRQSGGLEKTLAVVSGEFDLYKNLESTICDAKKMLSNPLGFVVLDAIVALVAWGQKENPNDDASVKRLLRFVDSMARKHQISILFIGHTNKGKDHKDIADSVAGSGAWTSSVRLAYLLQSVPEYDFTGIIRVIKTNILEFFCQYFKTVPVHHMKPNSDGHSAVLCKTELTSTRVYGLKNIEQEVDTEDGELTKKQIERKLKINALAEKTMSVLYSGQLMSRKEIEQAIVPMRIIPREWQALEPLLIERGVTATHHQHNKTVYQIVAVLHAE